MIRYFAGRFFPIAGEDCRGQITFDDEDGLPAGTSVTAPATKFWLRFGQIVYLHHRSRFTVAVQVPSLTFMLQMASTWENAAGLLHSLDEPTEGIERFIELFGHPGVANPDSANNRPDMQRLLEFERLTLDEQTRGIRILRWLYAHTALMFALNSFAEQQFTASDQRYAQSILYWLMNAPFSYFRRRFQRTVERQREQVPYYLGLWGRFLQIYNWEEEAVLGTPIGEFLPPDLRPVIGRGGDIVTPDPEPESQPQIELDLDIETGEEVEPTDPAVHPDRWAFYQSLGCNRIVRPEGWFGHRRYVAYLLRTPGGRKLAALDCNTPANAAYLFWVSQEGVPRTAWARHAQLSKREVLQRQGEQGFTFDRRFVHAGDWQNRFRRWFNDR
jgi:hypothetical protein